jgi:UDPglucose 6-dehydrogenase
MKISVMGINHNELLSGKALVEMGNEVVYVSTDNKLVENMKHGYFHKDEKKIFDTICQKSIEFTDDIKEALRTTNMCFISEDKTQDSSTLFNILSKAKKIGQYMTSHTFIVDRSPLPMNRTKQIIETVQHELDKRSSNLTFEVISNPNFLRA